VESFPARRREVDWTGGYTNDLGEELRQELAIAKERKVPLLLAAGIPTADNARLSAQMGIDL
jgi:hypothetical protein